MVYGHLPALMAMRVGSAWSVSRPLSCLSLVKELSAGGVLIMMGAVVSSVMTPDTREPRGYAHRSGCQVSRRARGSVAVETYNRPWFALQQRPRLCHGFAQLAFFAPAVYPTFSPVCCNLYRIAPFPLGMPGNQASFYLLII